MRNAPTKKRSTTRPQGRAPRRSTERAHGAPASVPHESDPVPPDDGIDPQQRVIEQARRDIERGLQDTDCRSDHGEDSACPPWPQESKR